MLHVHGFCDYFFQTSAADFWADHGYDFYALDLRKYGRSLRPHQTPNFTTTSPTTARSSTRPTAASPSGTGTPRGGQRSLDRGADRSAVAGAHRRRSPGSVLNSPWLDLNGSFLLRTAGTQAIDQLGARRPYQAIPRNVSGLYGRSLHRDHGGEWDFDLAWKPLESLPVYAGWLRAVRRGQQRCTGGSASTAPVLVLTSAAQPAPPGVGAGRRPAATSSST